MERRDGEKAGEDEDEGGGGEGIASERGRKMRRSDDEKKSV